MSKTVLITDDQFGIRRLLTEVIESRGINVLQASDGLEALEKLKNNAVDLMLLDMKMPNMDGLDTLKALKERNIDVDVIFMTAYGEEKLTVDAKGLGSNSHIFKPFDLEDVIEIVENHLFNKK
ncbi:response regulator [Proteinivorax hydrogeniformans]|uniref:Stage 0 sporulation protein A homolog n=1 Tax=Proteinivorax hydrogeniformans TaxID=1826727 RepID=A0AAU8HTS4_9FIRM